MSDVLLAKLLLGPGLVVAASLAGRRWGSALAGVLVSVPIVLGPILLIVTIEQGEAFGADAATSSLLAMLALAVFTVVFERAGRTLRWELTTLAGWAAFVVIALLVSRAETAPVVALVVAICAFAAAIAVTPPPPAPGERTTPPPWWDLPARALATAVLILALTGAADGLGPELAGALAPFPVATTVVAAFVLAQDGSAPATDMLRGFMRGIYGTIAFCFLTAVLIEPLGTAAAFAIGFAGSIAVAAALLAVRRSGA
ncbi:MAG: hypothetical protein JW895_08850 [Thermoleophilaceae bacterium]|nr:hypothetical protein [Thermoleophilaceae bacterium]